MITGTGSRVLNYLKSKFPQLIAEQRTAQILELMDLIELGKLELEHAIRDLIQEVSQLYSQDRICELVLNRGLGYVNRNWNKLLSLKASAS